MKSSFQNLLLWFFPTRYFDNADDLRDWNLNYRKEYAVFSRGAALAAMIISVILYYVADIHRFKDNSGLLIAIIYRLATILLCSLVIGYSFTGHYYSSRWFKLPVLMLALVSSFFEAYVNLRLDPVTPLYYCYLIPFLGVWVCQFGPGLSVLILAFILLPISYGVVLVHGYEHFYYFNAISLTMLSISMLFLMRIEMLNKIKYFLINKKYLEETRLRLEETKLRYKETELRYKELGDLATQVAHDIRSPLSAIMI
jgi:signal transduction histidine kinase